MRKLILISVILLTFWGCEDDEKIPQPNIQGGEILIANQGNFGWGEGSLTLYNTNSKSTQDFVFKAINNESMGNVFQSIANIEGTYYFVINNSGKIIVTDSLYKKTNEINGLTSPRYIYAIDDTKAYVTDLYAKSISVIDLKTNEISNKIPCQGWSERAVLVGDYFWFTAPDSDKLYAIDIIRDNIVDSAVVDPFPESVVTDNSGNIWVLCRGDKSKAISASLIKLSKENLNMELKIPLSGVPTSLVHDHSTDKLFYISENVWFMHAEDTVPKIFVENENRVLYGLAVDPTSQEIYISDAKDFVSRSEVFRYNKSGVLVDRFLAGIIAGDFFFP